MRLWWCGAAATLPQAHRRRWKLRREWGIGSSPDSDWHTVRSLTIRLTFMKWKTLGELHAITLHAGMWQNKFAVSFSRWFVRVCAYLHWYWKCACYMWSLQCLNSAHWGAFTKHNVTRKSTTTWVEIWWTHVPFAVTTLSLYQGATNYSHYDTPCLIAWISPFI